LRVLVVEDEAMVAFAMETALSEAGHTVVGLARDEKLALSLARSQQPELALVDFKLARGSSGEAVAIQLHALGIPTLFVSANPKDCKNSSAPGALACLAKPFTDMDVVAAVETAQKLMAGDRPKMTPKNLEVY
jgi:DNA-binding response OmpR family regulator